MSGWRVAVLALLVLLIGLPLAAPFRDALAYPGAWHVWVEGGRLLGLARNTLLLVAGTLALALPVGVVGAVLLYRTDLPLAGFFRLVALLTLFVPLPLFASGWQAALGSGGLLPATFWSPPAPSDPDVSPTGLVWKTWGRGLNAALWIHTIAALPWVVLLVGQGLRWVERDLEEEALTFAGPWRVLWRVTLRRSLAAIGGAALWVMLQTATEITVTDMFQVRTFGEEVYTQFVAPDASGAVARAVVASLPAVLLTAALVLAATSWWERRLPPLETLSTSPHVYRLGRARWPCCAALAVIVLALAAAPVGSLVWKVGLGGSPRHWSAGVALDHLRYVLRIKGSLVGESLALAGVAGAVTAALALVTCWLALGARWFHAAILLLIAAAWSLPGPVVGLGLKGAISVLLPAARGGLLERALYLGPSPLPALWAYLLRFFPCAVVVLWPVVRLLPRDLREAARVDGAGPAQELRYVVGPLTFPAALRAALVVAVLALGELSAGKLVETPGSQTFAHEVFTQMHYGVTNDLAAFCLILLATVALGGALVALAGWVVRRPLSCAPRPPYSVAMPSSPWPSYDDALAFWYGRINYEQRTPRPGELKLDRMRALLRLLGDPQDRLRILHVAGSKGKGSTAAMLAAVLTRAGYRTGLFTSPHLTRVEERIQVDGRPVSPDELAALLAEVRAVLDRSPGLEPTFFEVATALGFLHFRRRGVGAAVVEVGLGGRFDSTNVCRPVLAVITSISLDHTQQLGDHLASIAAEKAGIIKPGRPVVSGVTAPEARPVIERVARERRAPLRQLGAEFRYECVPGRVTDDVTIPARVRVETARSPRGEWMELGLLGDHQAANAALAVSCAEVLREEGWHVPNAAVAGGLAGVRWPARMEVVGRRPLVVLDCAHNVASAEALVATLRASFPPGRRWLVFAGSADKDLAGMFRVLAPHFAGAFLTRYAGSARGVPADELAALLGRTAGLPHTVCPAAPDAWRAARAAAGPGDLICVTGSVFLAGELRPLLPAAGPPTAGA